MTKEAVHWLLDRGIKMMGIDAVGFDPPVPAMFERRKFWEAHRVMLEREYYHLENLCNLDRIPPPYHSFTVSVLPVNWRGASAAPVRAVAILEAEAKQRRGPGRGESVAEASTMLDAQRIGHTGITWPSQPVEEKIADLAAIGFPAFETFGHVVGAVPRGAPAPSAT